MVIATDMAFHFDLMTIGKGAIPDASNCFHDKSSLVLQLILHISDISNPARPFKLASRWAELLVLEFLHQVSYRFLIFQRYSRSCIFLIE